LTQLKIGYLAEIADQIPDSLSNAKGEKKICDERGRKSHQSAKIIEFYADVSYGDLENLWR